MFDNIVPAIIDDSVFKEVGRLLDRNKHKCKMKSERRFLLSGKIFCGDCGSQMYGYSGTSKTDREYIYYKCKNAIKHNCAAKMMSRDWIEDYAVNQAMEYILSPESLKNVAKDMVTFHNSSIEDAIVIKALEKHSAKSKKDSTTP